MRHLLLAFVLASCRRETAAFSVDVPPPTGSAPMILPMASALPSAAPSASATPYGFRAGQAVEVEWQNEWWPAHVAEVHAGFPPTYLVHYDGYDDSWDEEVGLDRIRDLK